MSQVLHNRTSSRKKLTEKEVHASVNDETIVALATAPGSAGVAVIRISGPACRKVAESVLGEVPKPRYAQLSNFKNHQGELIDSGLALFFPGPNSFTGEDCLELQGHGGKVVTELMIKTCLESGARLARAGEFTQRAYLNGKIDLAQSEAVLDLIHARSELAAKGAVASLSGAFSHAVSSFRTDLINLRMWVEAHLDFVEEEIPQQDASSWHKKLKNSYQQLEALLDRVTMSAKLNTGYKMVLVGRPNAGKSSLLNALVGHSRAIVTDIPGTTRDLITADITINNLPIEVVDTAGLTETDNKVEQIGIDRAREELESADLVVWVIDSTKAAPSAADLGIDKVSAPLIKILNKADKSRISAQDHSSEVSLSAKKAITDFSELDSLRDMVSQKLNWNEANAAPWLARQRHVDALQRCVSLLRDAHHKFEEHAALELLAEDLRAAQHALDEITGTFDADDLLGKIFSEFCVGK
jgi:tRNA modification GTPase